MRLNFCWCSYSFYITKILSLRVHSKRQYQMYIYCNWQWWAGHLSTLTGRRLERNHSADRAHVFIESNNASGWSNSNMWWRKNVRARCVISRDRNKLAPLWEGTKMQPVDVPNMCPSPFTRCLIMRVARPPSLKLKDMSHLAALELYCHYRI
jgi:hypothetical protein